MRLIWYQLLTSQERKLIIRSRRRTELSKSNLVNFESSELDMMIASWVAHLKIYSKQLFFNVIDFCNNIWSMTIFKISKFQICDFCVLEGIILPYDGHVLEIFRR